ncbi:MULTISPECIES: TIGR02757 family protein [Sphingobacterium]|uniref:TIGR02757 family protein n=1 Tax=Sphingobacterium populi TaxID=1812824 RepID=A0ABW5U9L0_9SPHI|nr:TIGR02757 family protein [Sphingobacterium sp. CFCC 11742]
MAHFDLKEFLDQKVAEYNRPDFIESDPIVIPHRFTLKQDVEIMGLFASILAWGQRKTIINKCTELIARMQGEPYAFVLHHSDQDLAGLLGFKHRTFNDTDLLYFIAFLRHHYTQHDSLEMAFVWGQEDRERVSVEQALNYFKSYFFSLLDYPERTRKHVSSPMQKSSCKRLNMFLRWMVRRDAQGVDFGIWTRIRPADLICPCDVHVERVGRKLGMITTPTVNWNMAMELTAQLRLLDPLDPVKYDFALFGLGVEGRL